MFHILSDEETPYGPILIQHGTGQSSVTWFYDKSEQTYSTLPIVLARAGYDVWLGNTRGSKFSTEHETLTDKDPDYWHFSFSEIGLYDLPAMIDYIYEENNQTPITYLAHS